MSWNGIAYGSLWYERSNNECLCSIVWCSNLCIVTSSNGVTMKYEFDDLNAWRQAAISAGKLVKKASSDVEDPYDHYFAVDTNGDEYGYFGDAHGSDATVGFLADTVKEYRQEFGY